MKNFLYISYQFNNPSSSAGVRCRGFAKYLPMYGWNPIVLTPDVRGNREFPEFDVYRTDYEYMEDKWRRRLHLPEKDMGSNVPTKNDDDNEDGLSSRLMKKGVHILGELFAFPDGMKGWYAPAMAKAREIIEEEDIQLILSSSPPVTPHKIASDLSEEFDIPWVANLHDLWTQDPYKKHNFIRQYREKKYELKTLSNAKCLVTNAPKASNKLRELHNLPTRTVLTGYDDKLYYLPPRDSDKFVLTYAGILYGGKRDPRPLFRAVDDLIHEGVMDPDKMELRFYGDNSGLKGVAQEYNLQDIVKLYGRVPHDEIIERELESTILLLLSWINPYEKYVVPGKIFEYLALHKPILSIGHPDCAVGEIIKKTQTGINVTTYEEIKKQLHKYYLEYQKNGKIEYNGIEKEINKYSVVNTSKQLAKLFNQIQGNITLC